MVLDSEQKEKALKKIRETRFKQDHVLIKGRWLVAGGVKTFIDGEPCIVCGRYNNHARLYCPEDDLCRKLGRRMGLCIPRRLTVSKEFSEDKKNHWYYENNRRNLMEDRIGIHKLERVERFMKYKTHYSLECSDCGKVMGKEKMPQELLDEMYPPDILSDIQKTENQNYKQHLRKEVGGKLRHEVFFRDGYRCLECGRTNQNSVLHADHIKPVSLGGLTTLENLQTLCSICNHAKWAREWKAGLRTAEEEPELLDEDDT